MSEDSIYQRLSTVQDAIAASEAAIEQLHSELRATDEKLRNAFKDAVQGLESSAVDLDKLDEFIAEWTKRPYAIRPRKPGEWELIIPKLFKLHYGWFETEDGPYNIFIVNRYFDLIEPVPPALKEELDLSRPFDGIIVDQGQLIIKRPDRDPMKKVQKHYARYLVTRPTDEQTIAVRKGQEFNLIAALIRDGILPFVPRPIAREDLRDQHCSFTLRDYQTRDLKRFKELGACGVFYPMGMGKTVIGLEAMCQLKGRKLVLVPSIMLREQWLEKIREHTKLQPDEYLVQVYHQNYIPQLMREDWTLVIYDEMHRLPANTYLELSTLRTKYRLNLTATPWREDGRIDLIWALSGMPLGVDWSYFLERGLIVRPEITVYVDADLRAKTARCDALLGEPGKTIIFCDSIELGQNLASRYGIPFVHGETPAATRMELVRNSEQVVVSRVGDLGISINDLKRVVEFDFLFGSRSQELQRLGRLFHSDFKGTHNVLMTAEQYARHRKRLYGVYEKGFKINVIRGPGVVQDLSSIDSPPQRAESPARPVRERPVSTRPVSIVPDDASQFPLLDERRKLDRALILEILGSDYVKSRGGVEIKTIRAILDHNHIKYRDDNQVKHLVNSMFASFDISGRTVGRIRTYFLTKEVVQ